jgi:FkbM family methyltransferase
MYILTNFLKSQIKKYIPTKLYFLLYKLYRNIKSSVTGKKSTAVFTVLIQKHISIGDVAFLLELDPVNGLVDAEIFEKGVWERDMLLEIQQHIGSHSVCLDIGANIGQHSLYMASIAGQGVVYAFEPIQKLAQQIKRSAILNDMQNVTIEQFALSNKNEIRNIYLNNLNMGNTTFRKRLGASTIVKAETKIFDEYWNDRLPINFIKIDVEGYEYYALLGMQKTLEKYKPTIILEFTPSIYAKMNILSDEFLTYLFSFGYKLYDLEDNKREILQSDIIGFLARTPSQTNILCIPSKI